MKFGNTTTAVVVNMDVMENENNLIETGCRTVRKTFLEE